MSTGKTLTKSEVTFHKPVDTVDPGFAIKGHKLRWCNGKVESRRAGRIWSTIKISQFSKDIQDKILEINPRWVEGDTIRRRGDVLTMAPIKLVEEKRAEIKDAQRANEAIFRGGASAGGEIKSTGDSSMRDERVRNDSDSFR
jgi:hypothetical protein